MAHWVSPLTTKTAAQFTPPPDKKVSDSTIFTVVGLAGGLLATGMITIILFKILRKRRRRLRSRKGIKGLEGSELEKRSLPAVPKPLPGQIKMMEEQMKKADSAKQFGMLKELPKIQNQTAIFRKRPPERLLPGQLKGLPSEKPLPVPPLLPGLRKMMQENYISNGKLTPGQVDVCQKDEKIQPVEEEEFDEIE
ncbi:hypothetical protein SNE40_004802 [Patella caerulea]|uniref:Uncharacterized protein n=1 Tax=Patella caerulea TaxID=87958 RepID=A0AAN8KAE0_PATCE